MNILVTGAGGYLGSIIVEKLQKQDDARITLINKRFLPEFGDLKQIQGDLNDPHTYEPIKNTSFDLILHAAGYVPKNKKEDEKDLCVSGNITATENLLRFTHYKKILFLSTCEIYGDGPKTILVAEQMDPHPISHYAHSKYEAEHLCTFYSKKRNAPLCILRFTTIIGSHDRIQRAIPNFISAALAHKNITISSSTAARDYLYVKDAADAAVQVATHFHEGIYNVSSGKAQSVQKAAQTIIQICTSPSKVVLAKNPDNSGSQKMVFDSTLFQKTFHFKPKYSFRKAAQEIIHDTHIIVLDFDGTLIDVSNRWYNLHRTLARQYDYSPLLKSDYIALKRDNVHEEQIIRKTNIPRKNIDQYLQQRITMMEHEEFLKQDIPKPGIYKILKKLNKQNALVLLTKRTNGKNLEKELHTLNFYQYFSDIIWVPEGKKGATLQQFCHNNNLKVRCVVGDTGDDYKVSTLLKVPCILMADGCRSKKMLECYKNATIIDHLSQLPQAVANIKYKV